MKYELLGFGAWALVYFVLKTTTMRYVSTDYWFIIGCATGIICAAILRIVSQLRKENG